MLARTTFSRFFHSKRQQMVSSPTTVPVVDGSLAEEANDLNQPVLCRAPSRIWWEQAWQLRH